VRAVAETGVDLISSGALTHSVRVLDIGLDIARDSAVRANEGQRPLVR
jgi:nicotinate-nucleotide pyrophosphorylase (carboxylating)